MACDTGIPIKTPGKTSFSKAVMSTAKGWKFGRIAW
jgi:hypothetical protein